jgi:hypothetical protein
MEQINKVLYNVDQTADTTEAQKAQARANIGVEALPDKTGNAGKVLAVNSTATGLEWVAGGGSQVQSNWAESDTTSPAYIQNKPTLATVATSGSYNDLSNTPEPLPARPVSSYKNYSLMYSTNPNEMSMSWSLRDSRNLRTSEVTVGLNSSSRIEITQYMLDNHIAYFYFDKTKFPDLGGGYQWWDVKLWGMRIYKQTADASLAGAEWDVPLILTTSPIATPHNDSNTAYLTTLRYKWQSTGLFTDYQGFAFTVDLLNSDTEAMFVKLDLYGYTSSVAVGDEIYIAGSVRPCTNIM